MTLFMLFHFSELRLVGDFVLGDATVRLKDLPQYQSYQHYLQLLTYARDY